MSGATTAGSAVLAQLLAQAGERGADMATLRAMLRASDVFIENFRPGTLEEMGLAPHVLLADNPSLIIVRVSGFGQTGPYAELPGFGTIVEAMSGFAHRTGFPDREPVLPPLALADMVAGLERRGVSVLLSGVRPDHERVLRELGVHDVLGHERHVFATTPEALAHARSHVARAAPQSL